MTTQSTSASISLLSEIIKAFSAPFYGGDYIIAIGLIVTVLFISFFIVGQVWGTLWNKHWSILRTKFLHTILVGFISILLSALACTWYGINNNSLRSESISNILDIAYVVPQKIVNSIESDINGDIRKELLRRLPTSNGYNKHFIVDPGEYSIISNDVDSIDKMERTVAETTITAANTITRDYLKNDPVFFIINFFTPEVNIDTLLSRYNASNATPQQRILANPEGELSPLLSEILTTYTKAYRSQGNELIRNYQKSHGFVQTLLLILFGALLIYVPFAACSDIKTKLND